MQPPIRNTNPVLHPPITECARLSRDISPLPVAIQKSFASIYAFSQATQNSAPVPDSLFVHPFVHRYPQMIADNIQSDWYPEIEYLRPCSLICANLRHLRIESLSRDGQNPVNSP